MIIVIDAIGLLTIAALAHQGYKEALGIRKSFLLPAFFSVLIFYKTFPLIYALISSAVPSQILAGVLTIMLVNFCLITIFYKIFVHLLNKFEERFFLPDVSLHLRQTLGVFVGILTGYVFIAGVIESLDSSISRTSIKKNSVLANSVFYQISHRKESKLEHINKIDNLPSLKLLYSEENVAVFDFSEDELVAILQMIRAISNQDAQILLNNINTGNSTASVYKALLEAYALQGYIQEKYRVNPEIFGTINQKINNKTGFVAITK